MELQLRERALRKETEGRRTVDSTALETHLSETEMESRVLLEKIDRSKEDVVVLKKRVFDMEVQLRKSKFSLGQQQKQHRTALESRLRAAKTRELLQDSLQGQRRTREDEIMLKQSAVGEFKELGLRNVSRAAELEELADRVMLEKDGSEKSFECLMLAHKFLTQVLRDKMEREMSRFRLIEGAFKAIKIATGVSETSQLVSKFLNKEAAYGELLFKIAENEKRIEELRGDSAALQAQRKVLEEDINLFEVPERPKVDLEDQLKRLKEVERQSKQAQILDSQVRGWVRRTVRKLNLVSQADAEEGLGSVLGRVAKLARLCTGDKVTTVQLDLDWKDYLERNVRIALQGEEPS